MQSDRPKEYVTLVHGDSENFSEVYGHRYETPESEESRCLEIPGNTFPFLPEHSFSIRLHNPTECPYNGSRQDECPCRKDYTAAGFSTFHKIRIDLATMHIISKWSSATRGDASVLSRSARVHCTLVRGEVLSTQR